MPRLAILVLPALIGSGMSAAAAEPVLVQCGREYQAAKTAGTLNGMDWSRFRVDCAARLKDGTAAPPAASAGAPQPAAMPASAPAAAPTRSTTGGMTAMHGRQKQCGAEWRTQKTSLVAQTPGLTWPRYWSQCNARLKAAGQ